MSGGEHRRGSVLGTLLVASLLAATAVAAGAGVESFRDPIFARFDHGAHRKVLEKQGWTCLACHGVGAVPAEAGSGAATAERSEGPLMLPAAGVCHACHTENRVRGAPQRCRSCHEPGSLEEPASHGAGWIQDHGERASQDPRSCSSCHLDRACVDCHVRRDQVGNEVHSGNWESVHGLAARSDPVSCEGCHEGSTCLACHRSPEGRQGW
jgi:hypothetical protein